MKANIVRCFGLAPGYGNVALVIQDGPADVDQRQAFAAGSGASACVFLTPLSEGDIWSADYYYPHARSPLCLHASLAAAHVLFNAHPARPLQLRTAMRDQLLPLTASADGAFVSVRRQAVAPIGIAPGLAQHLLGQPDLQLASPPLLSSVGSAKLLIEVADSATLHALHPPLERIVDWGKEHGVSGCFVYARLDNDVYEGRNFNHLDPAREDNATGVAAGALSAYHQRSLTLLQGEHLGNPCRIITHFHGTHIDVGGATELLAH